MNSDNIVSQFFEAWKNDDFEKMKNLSADDISELAFSAIDINGFDVGGYRYISETGCKLFSVDIETPDSTHKLSITVIPKPGPFKAVHPYGVVSGSVIEALPKDQVLLSTDMSAKEAIQHIKDQPAKKAKNFVSEKEERVTVLDALESKK